MCLSAEYNYSDEANDEDKDKRPVLYSRRMLHRMSPNVPLIFQYCALIEHGNVTHWHLPDPAPDSPVDDDFSHVREIMEVRL